MWNTTYSAPTEGQDNWVQTVTAGPCVTAEYHESLVGCCRLCYDCEAGSYCWDSDMNENKNS